MSQQSKPIHAFMAGTHTTRLGQAVTISAADLAASAKAYNPELHEAPLVIGHPDGKAPAYGWIASCAVEADDFFVTAKQINPDFAELHNAGAFKKRSMSFYHPDNNLNPVPGVWYPRHLGFLGAQAPAIKGLSGYEFEEAAGDGDTLTVDFGEFEDRLEAGMWRNLREWILDKFGKDDADAAVAGYDVDFLQTEALREKDQSDTAPAFSEQHKTLQNKTTQNNTTQKEGEMTPEEIAAQKAQLEAQKLEQEQQAADFSEREKKLAEREQATHKATCADFIESQIAAGKVLPAQKNNLVAFMTGLESVETVDFSENDTTVKKSPLAFMQDYLATQPKLVEFGEHAGGDSADPVNMEDANMLAAAAVEFQESEASAGRTISVTQAVAHIKKSQGDN